MYVRGRPNPAFLALWRLWPASPARAVNQTPLRDHLQTAHTPRHWSLFLVSNPNYSEASKLVCIPSPNITIQFGPLWVCDAPPLSQASVRSCNITSCRLLFHCNSTSNSLFHQFFIPFLTLATFYRDMYITAFKKLKQFQVPNLIGSDRWWKVQRFLSWMWKMWRQEPILRKTNRIAGKANQGVIRQQKVGRRRNQDDWL